MSGSPKNILLSKIIVRRATEELYHNKTEELRSRVKKSGKLLLRLGG
jgi:hypothetical protein